MNFSWNNTGNANQDTVMQYIDIAYLASVIFMAVQSVFQRLRIGFIWYKIFSQAKSHIARDRYTQQEWVNTWEMIAHERWETLGGWGKAGGWVRSSSPLKLIPMLAVPLEVDFTATSNAFFRNASTVRPTAASNPEYSERVDLDNPFLQLPYELLFCITTQLDLNSLYTLSRCSRGLLKVLHPEVHNRFRNSLAPWKNTPLICAGDYIRSNPPGITAVLSDESLLDRHGMRHLKEAVEYKRIDCRNFPVYHLMNLLGNSTDLSEGEPISIPKLNRGTLPPTTNQSWRRSRSILELEQYFPIGRGWVLRNLTQKEYVYADVLTSSDGNGGGEDRPDGEHDWGFNLGTVVAVNTCWSDDWSTSMSGLDIRGRWAGDRFDIVVKDKLMEDMANDDWAWQDVSLCEWKKLVDLSRKNHWGWDE